MSGTDMGFGRARCPIDELPLGLCKMTRYPILPGSGFRAQGFKGSRFSSLLFSLCTFRAPTALSPQSQHDLCTFSALGPDDPARNLHTQPDGAAVVLALAGSEAAGGNLGGGDH
eukprot:1932450-Rhodomonas_salina.1